MLEDITGGLTRESAEEICRRLLPETRAMTIAVTDRDVVLACVGELADDFPAGSPIHTPTTRYVIEHGIAQSFTSVMDVRGEKGSQRNIPAGIIAPLKIRGKAVGTLKVLLPLRPPCEPHAVRPRLGLCRAAVHAAHRV